MSEIEVTNQLCEFFRNEGRVVETEVQRYFPNSERFVRADFVLNHEIAVEVKTNVDMTPLAEGIGKAILYLQFFKESWLAVPTVAMEVVLPTLGILKSLPFRVLDWEKLELYEITKKGEIRKSRL